MEAKTAFNVHQQEKNVLRKFYYSSTRMKRKRRYEYRNEKHMIVFAPLREEAASLVLLKRGSLCLSVTETMATAPQ
jgi:hypothetical protein